MKKHWYKTFIGCCPVCGREKSYKVRMYTPKPKNKDKRYIYLPDNLTYDWCDI